MKLAELVQAPSRPPETPSGMQSPFLAGRRTSLDSLSIYNVPLEYPSCAASSQTDPSHYSLNPPPTNHLEPCRRRFSCDSYSFPKRQRMHPYFPGPFGSGVGVPVDSGPVADAWHQQAYEPAYRPSFPPNNPGHPVQQNEANASGDEPIASHDVSDKNTEGPHYVHTSLPERRGYADSYAAPPNLSSAWHNRRSTLPFPRPHTAHPPSLNEGPNDWHYGRPPYASSSAEVYRQPPWSTPAQDMSCPQSASAYAPPPLSLPPIPHYLAPHYDPAFTYSTTSRRNSLFEAQQYAPPEQPPPPSPADENLSAFSIESSEERAGSPTSISSVPPSPGLQTQPLPRKSRQAPHERLSPALDPKEGRYTCQFCSKRFTRPSSLKIHMHSHTGERPFECPTCGRSFSVQSNLKRHQKIHLQKNSIDSNASTNPPPSTGTSDNSRRGSGDTT